MRRSAGLPNTSFGSVPFRPVNHGSASLVSFALVMLTVFLLLAAPLTPSPVGAAGGEIRVVEASQQVNYPSGVGLSVTIEADAEIAEVRVYYRPAGSRQWGYAYADFQPGTNVVAVRSIPVRESTYIAPGADVEYYYEIRDVGGNLVRTEPTVVEYLDQRFPWRRVNIGPLELLYHDISDSEIEKTSQALLEDLQRVANILELEQSAGFKGVIYNNYSDANAAFPVQSQTTTDHGTFAGYAFPEQRVFVGQGLDRRIIVHESAHLMLREALGSRTVELPAWLNEGFATYMEPNVRIRSSSDLYRSTPHLKAMKNLSGTPDTIPLFYRKSVSVVAHLVEEYGEERFRRLLGEIARGRTIEAALVGVYGFDEHGLDSSWAGLTIPAPVVPAPRAEAGDAPRATSGESQPPGDSSVEDKSAGPSDSATNRANDPEAVALRPTTLPQSQQPQQQGGPSPYIYFDVWLLAGVALLVVVVLSIRFVYRRLNKRDRDPSDPWETWQPNDLDRD